MFIYEKFAFQKKIVIVMKQHVNSLAYLTEFMKTKVMFTYATIFFVF
jgi:hypothetical protein